MTTLRSVVTALCGLAVLLPGPGHAGDATVDASVTLDGKVIALAYGRAYSTGLPFILIYLAEKPLDGFRYGSGGNLSTWAGGDYGTVLRLAPMIHPDDLDAEVQRYLIPEAAAGEDDRVELRTPSIADWQEQWLAQTGIRIDAFESRDGVVHGRLSWAGEGPVSAWSATFRLSLEKGAP